MTFPFWLKLAGRGPKSLTAQMAWDNIQNYLFMAHVQLTRIAENNTIWSLGDPYYEAVRRLENADEEAISRFKYLNLARYTGDAHFYLNCWRIIALNAFRIARAVDCSRIDDFLVSQQCPKSTRGNSLYFGDAKESLTLGWYAQGRDHFEHIDERIFGERNYSALQVPASGIKTLEGFEHLKVENAEYFPSPHFDGIYMRVGEKKWEISAHAHQSLRKSVDELEEIGRQLVEEQSDDATE